RSSPSLSTAARTTTGANQPMHPFMTAAHIVAERQIHTDAAAGARRVTCNGCVAQRASCTSVPVTPHHEKLLRAGRRFRARAQRTTSEIKSESHERAVHCRGCPELDRCRSWLLARLATA